MSGPDRLDLPPYADLPDWLRDDLRDRRMEPFHSPTGELLGYRNFVHDITHFDRRDAAIEVSPLGKYRMTCRPAGPWPREPFTYPSESPRMPPERSRTEDGGVSGKPPGTAHD